MSALHMGTNVTHFFRGKLGPAALVMVCLLPLLFGGLFVWSYEDPIGHLDRMPVAVVNSDEGTHGEELTNRLIDSGRLDFRQVSAEEAREGIANGRYYMGLEVPTDFSEAVTSVKAEHPHQATINVTLNNANGFIATMLSNQAASLITATVSDSAGEEVANQLLMGFNEIGEGMDKAADGADQLHDGTTQLTDGSTQLRDGATELDHGIHEANNGATQLRDGATELDSGAARLDAGAQELAGGISQAREGADHLAGGLGKLQGGTQRLGDGATQISQGVDQIAGLAEGFSGVAAATESINAQLDGVANQVAQIPLPEAQALASQIRATKSQIAPLNIGTKLNDLQRLQDGAAQLADQLGNPNAEYRSGVDQAAQGAQALASGLARLEEGSGTLAAGTTTLHDGTQRLVVGTRSLSDGTSQLAAGSERLVVGLNDLNDGAVRIDAGAGDLSLAIADGAERAPEWRGERLDQAAETASKPVTTTIAGQEVTIFGLGLAPFFLSISMWVGGLMMFMILRPINRRAIDSGMTPLRALLTVLAPAFVISAVQATLLWLVEVLMLHFHPAHPWQLWMSLTFVGWVFVSVILAINVLIGPTSARAVVMALMSLQLVASNGLYPPELQPAFIRWVNHWDPMRFSVDLFRHSYVGSLPGDHRPLLAVVVLAFITLAAIALGALGYRRERRILRKDLHPELTM